MTIRSSAYFFTKTTKMLLGLPAGSTVVKITRGSLRSQDWLTISGRFGMTELLVGKQEHGFEQAAENPEPHSRARFAV
jgi:hypothetical protein